MTLCHSASTRWLYSAIPGSSGNLGRMGGDRGTSRSSSGGDGDGSGNVNPVAVTPVARETLLGTWAVSSSGV